MNPLRLIAAILVIAGVLGLAYGSFSYTRDTNVVKLGPIEINAQEKHTINIPVWAGIAGILVGGMLFVYGGRRS
jgi:hypothetical protein